MLSQFLVTELFAFLLIFCRVGSAIMILPGFGEAYVSMRVRLMLALMFSLVVTPAITNMPPVPATVSGLFILVLAEILIGIFMGGLSRILISATHIAGTIMAMQSSLASALVQDVTQVSGQSSPLSNLLGVSSLVLLFSLDLHHLMLRGLMDSYSLFLPGTFPIVEDFSNHATQMMNSAFIAAFKMSSPHIVIGLILYLGAGIVARLVPNIQVFFLMLPSHILISMFILFICFSSIMMWYMEYFQDALGAFIAPQ